MTARLTAHTLGQLTILLDGQPMTDLSSRTAEALLIYLIYQKRPLSRQVLADFFWDDRPPERAAANLRTLLTMLRKSLGDFLIITRQSVALDQSASVYLDLFDLEEKLALVAPNLESTAPLDGETREQLRVALDLYQGDFLEGFYLNESRGFEEWSLLTRERLRRQVSSGLRQLVAGFLDEGRYSAGIEYAGRLLAVDPYTEEAHRQMMWLLVRNGQRNAALAHYHNCRRLLNEELGVEPAPATSAVYEQISSLTFPPPCRLPVEPTPFVGRERALAQIGQDLTNPHCRLLTILGAGGMGKTRLAVHVAAQLHRQRPGSFLGGIYYVSLATVDSAMLLIMAIAEALHLPFEGSRAPQDQLLNYLRDKELLLVLDNVEDLLADDDGIDFISTLLAQAPRVKMLTTSRERLNLHEEWLYDMEGLAYPDGEIGEDKAVEQYNVAQYDAVQLFLQSAARLQRSFAPTPEDLAAIVRICRLLDGLPLGLELAAAWVRQQSCAEIATQIAHDLDFLATSLRNVPARHRSLRAVFEHSWHLLNSEQQNALCRLALFRERIAPGAAQAVAGALPALLSALVDKSLLRRRDGDGAFAMHELIRQYALEKLAETPNLVVQTWDIFCRYYARFLDQRAEALKGRGQQAALQEITSELENVRAAWDRVVSQRHYAELDLMLDTFHWYHWQRGYYQEGCEALAAAAKVLAAEAGVEALILARVQSRLAEFHSWLADYDEATRLLEASIPQLRQAEAWVDLGWALDSLSQIAYAQGNFSSARGYSEEALACFRRQEDDAGVAQSLTTLANALCDDLADYTAARPLYEESLALYRAIGDRYGQAKVIINLGALAHSLGEYEEARVYYEEGIILCRELGHRQVLAIALNNLGQVLNSLGDAAGAIPVLQESVSLRREMGDLRGLTLTLMSLANVSADLGQRPEAKRYFAESLRFGQRLASTALVADVLVSLADVLARWGAVSQAATLLIIVTNDVIEGEEIRQKARSILERLEDEEPAAVAAGRKQAVGKQILTAVDEMLRWLAA
jgi:DNA-binding SARP family transcriptional activator/predicted ATPase